MVDAIVVHIQSGLSKSASKPWDSALIQRWSANGGQCSDLLNTTGSSNPLQKGELHVYFICVSSVLECFARDIPANATCNWMSLGWFNDSEGSRLFR